VAKWSPRFFYDNKKTGKLFVHGKGKKDRSVPIPETITADLKVQSKAIGELHENSLATGYDGVFLEDAVAKKYPGSSKEFSYPL
jgi:hypothetical protein